MIRQALDPACEAVTVGDTSPVRDLTFVADTAAAFLAAGSAPDLAFGCAYNAGSQRRTSIGDLIRLVLDLTGCDKPVVQDTRRMRPTNSEVRALLADSARFEAASGWRARTSLRDGLEQTIAWWRERLSAGRVRAQMDYMT